MREVGQLSEFGWYRPGETVVREAQHSEVGQVSEFGRQAAVQWLRKGDRKGDRRDALRGSS